MVQWCGDHSNSQADQAWQVIGDPTEGALVVAAMKVGIDLSDEDRDSL